VNLNDANFHIALKLALWRQFPGLSPFAAAHCAARQLLPCRITRLATVARSADAARIQYEDRP